METQNTVLQPSLGQALSKVLGDQLLQNQSLKDWTTFHCLARAKFIVLPDSLSQLSKLIRLFKTQGLTFRKNWDVIGRGSNLLVRDGGYLGVLLGLTHGFTKIEVIEENKNEVKVRVEAGVPNGTLLQWVRERNLSGFGFSFGIPGSIGGGIRMNAGTPLGWFGQVLSKVEGVDLRGNKVEISVQESDFQYRDFPKGRDFLITAGHFIFRCVDAEEVECEIQRAKEKRKNQPLRLPNIGSVFKNPKGDYAARLIDAAGLKGERIGNAEISPLHSNFIVNLGNAKTKDVLKLMEKAQKEVKRHFSVELEPEVRVIGVDV